MSRRDDFRRYGSVRIFRDGRVRFSPFLTDPMLRYLSFIATSNSLDLERSSNPVVYMYLDRGRVTSACFSLSIAPDVLRALVSEMRSLGNGLERWILPALEYTSLIQTFREDNPEAYAIVPELLESCRDLPVADHWKRVRADTIARAERAQAKAERAAAKAARKTPRKGQRRRSRTPRESGPVQEKER